MMKTGQVEKVPPHPPSLISTTLLSHPTFPAQLPSSPLQPQAPPPTNTPPPQTTDRDYEVEERRYRTLESASLRLQTEAKGYLDSLRAMTASQMRIAETIDAFYGDSGAKDGVSRSYKQAVEDLDAETVKALDGPYR